MGVDRSYYIMYGWKLPYKLKDNEGNEIDLWDEKFESVMCGFPGEEFSLISDGMCGDYNAFGLRVLHCSDDGDGWDFVNLDIASFDAEKVKSKYVELFGIYPATEPTLFIFSHFS